MENAILNEKLNQTTAENKELNSNIEELDKQHDVAVERLLGMKNDVQDKYGKLKEEFDEILKNNKESHDEEKNKWKKENEKITEDHSLLERKFKELERIIEEVSIEKRKLQEDFNALQESDLELQRELNQKENSQEINQLQIKNSKLSEEILALKAEAQEVLSNDWDKKIEDLKVENRKIQEDFVALQEDDLNLQREFHELKKQNEIISVEKTKIQEDFTALQEDDLTLQRNFEIVKTEKLRIESEFNESKNLKETENYVEKVEAEMKNVAETKKVLEENLQKLQNELTSMQDKLTENEIAYKNRVQDLESQNNSMNVELQKQVIDLQSSLNNKMIEGNSTTGVSFDEVKGLLRNYMNYDGKSIDEKNYLEDFLKSIRDLPAKVELLEKKWSSSFKEISNLNEINSKILHEKETVQADLMHYEIECSELMKNNEILLNEIDNLKCGKLETIHENSEDSLVILEKQLEDCSNLNQSLEDEYLEVSQKIEFLENEKLDMRNKISVLEKDLDEKNLILKELQEQIQNLKIEKSNLIFEVNELKSDAENRLEENQNERENPYSNEELLALNQSIDSLTNEKNNLINLVTLKHNESVQYHQEIQRLNQLLQQQSQTNCEKCIQLEEMISSMRIDGEKMSDQITFLREKSDILTTNLITEQSHQKILNLEKHELNEQKNNLIKDLDRLRLHLIEVEEAHTEETVLLQKSIDDNQSKLFMIEEDVKKSSTAYTSAR